MCRCSASSSAISKSMLSDHTLGLVEGVARSLRAEPDEFVRSLVLKFAAGHNANEPVSDPLLPDSMQGETPPWWWDADHDPFAEATFLVGCEISPPSRGCRLS